MRTYAIALVATSVLGAGSSSGWAPHGTAAFDLGHVGTVKGTVTHSADICSTIAGAFGDT
jgi:hypothetical protein